MSTDVDKWLLTPIFNISLISEPGIMSEERTTWWDRIVLIRSHTSFVVRKPIQFLSITTQKAVDYIGGSKKAQKNMGGIYFNIVRYPT